MVVFPGHGKLSAIRSLLPFFPSFSFSLLHLSWRHHLKSPLNYHNGLHQEQVLGHPADLQRAEEPPYHCLADPEDFHREV